MATFKSNCPHCQTQLDLEREWIGMEVECPECQKSFPVTPPAQSAPKRQLPPPPKQNPLMGHPFAPPPPPKQNNPMGNPPLPTMMNEITANEYLYQRNKKILNIFAIICIILSIASATLAVINGLESRDYHPGYSLSNVRSYVNHRDNASPYYSPDNWSFELLYNENMSKEDRNRQTFYTLTTGEAMIFDVTEELLTDQIRIMSSSTDQIKYCIALSCAAVIFMMLAIFLKLCQISYCIAISRK